MIHYLYLLISLGPQSAHKIHQKISKSFKNVLKSPQGITEIPLFILYSPSLIFKCPNITYVVARI